MFPSSFSQFISTYIVILLTVHQSICIAYNITCDQEYQCNGFKNLTCIEGEDCDIYCLERYSCQYALITCPSGPYQCMVECNGHISCGNSIINATNTDGADLLLRNTGATGFVGSTVYCPANGDCDIKCAINTATPNTCKSMKIYSQSTTTLLNYHSGKGGGSIFKESEVHCPPAPSGGGTNCIITVSSGAYTNQMPLMEVYADEGFDHVTIDCKASNTNWCYKGDNLRPKLFCTKQFNQYCNLTRISVGTNWQCANGDADFCNKYTLNPTTDPTTDPTSTPTSSTSIPTMDPTIDPTADPTRIPSTHPSTKNPSKNPSFSPSAIPTAARSGSVETSTTSTTSKVENEEDLTINVTITDGTFNQYHVIRTVNDSLNAFLDTGYTLTADIIRPNVSINFLVHIYDEEEINVDINSTELSQKIQEDLNKDSDIVYVVEIRENVEATEEIEHPFGFDKFNELMVAICSFLALVILISYIDAKCCRINDYYRVGALIIAVFQFIDMIYDCLFSVKITLDPEYSTESPLFTLLLLSIAFIVLPTLITLIQLHFEMKEWKRNDEVSQWIFDNTMLLYILSAICGSSFIAVRVCCSNLLNLPYFDMPLSQIQRSAFYTKRIYSSVILENLPQLVIQTMYLFVFSSTNPGNNDIVYASMAFSVLSIVISILSILSQKNIIRSRDYVTIEFDVKGDMILSNFKRCKNRYKILRKHLSLMFGVNSNVIDIRKPSQVPNGLRAHIMVHINNTKAIDINCEKLIKDANKSGKLAKILKESWSLSQAPVIGNIKYEKYDSQDRKDNTVIIKAMSEQIKNNDTNNYVNIVANNSPMTMDSNPMNTFPTNTIQMVAIPQISIDDTEQPRGEHMPAMIPSVIVTPYHDDNIETVENNENLPAVIPPVIVTDLYRKSNGNDMEDTDNSEDSNNRLTVGTTGKQSVADYNTEDGDQDVVQYINSVTVGN